jgi:hypothetical protein
MCSVCVCVAFLVPGTSGLKENKKTGKTTAQKQVNIIKYKMNTALKNVFDSGVVNNIMAFVPVDDFEIDTLFGFTHISGVEHYITYGGGPRWFRILLQSAARKILLVDVAPGLVQRSGLHQG